MGYKSPQKFFEEANMSRAAKNPNQNKNNNKKTNKQKNPRNDLPEVKGIQSVQEKQDLKSSPVARTCDLCTKEGGSLAVQSQT